MPEMMPEKKEFSTPLTPGITKREHWVFLVITLILAALSISVVWEVFPVRAVFNAGDTPTKLLTLGQTLVSVVNAGIWVVLALMVVPKILRK